MRLNDKRINFRKKNISQVLKVLNAAFFCMEALAVMCGLMCVCTTCMNVHKACTLCLIRTLAE